ncbi:translation initiation factor eIF4e, partial [Calocera cornea HHB12733]
PEAAAASDTPPRPLGVGAASTTNPSSRLRLPQTLRTRAAGASSAETSPSATQAPQLPDTASTDITASSTSTAVSPIVAVTVEPPTGESTGTSVEFKDPAVPAVEEPKGAKPPRGYKNVPSLEAISTRLAALRERSTASQAQAHARTRSGEEDLPGEIVEAPPADDDTEATPTQAKARDKPATGASTGSKKKDEHPLLHHWVWYYDSKVPRSSAPSTAEFSQSSISTPSAASNDYEANLHVIGEIDTVEGFARYWNWCKPPSRLERGGNYHFFKKGIKPMWEDPANAKGGKWVLTMRNNPAYLDKCWTEILMSLVGELSLDPADEVTGCVVSLRSRIDRIQLWLRQKDDPDRVNALGKRMAALLGIEQEPGLMLEFQYHTDDWPNPGRYISLNT